MATSRKSSTMEPGGAAETALASRPYDSSGDTPHAERGRWTYGIEIAAPLRVPSPANDNSGLQPARDIRAAKLAYQVEHRYNFRMFHAGYSQHAAALVEKGYSEEQAYRLLDSLFEMRLAADHIDRVVAAIVSPAEKSAPSASPILDNHRRETRGLEPTKPPKGRFYIDRPKGMDVIEFLETDYGACMRGEDWWLVGEFTRAALRKIDPKAAAALTNWENYHGKEAPLPLPHRWKWNQPEPAMPIEDLRRAGRQIKRAYRKSIKGPEIS